LLISNIGYNTPFGTTDPEIMAEVLVELFEKYPEFAQEFTKKGQKLLAFGASDSYEIVTKFPINSVEDLKGRKIGGAGSNLGWIEPTGAIPVQAGLAEVYQSIQTGVFEGYIMYTRGTLGYRLHEVAPYFTEVGFGSILVSVLTINENTYNKLPAEVQKVIDEVGKELTYEIAKASKADREANLEKMIAEGAIHTVLPEAERAKWAAMLPNQPNEYAKKLNAAGLPGSEILRDYLKLLADKAGALPRTYDIE
jgi:TRAP-type C4-dicarboxylate transport system substrate-binding protein